MMPTDPRHAALHAVRQRIAAAILPPAVSPTLGNITLHPHQLDAVTRLLEILPRHHGALLADDVGLGKTYVALALARHYTEVHCLAPAPLCTMWRSAAERAGLRDLHIHSLHAMSRGPTTALGDGTRVLVIIDEAHALRNPATARYRAAATACAGADVLLISATPLHNHPKDLRALFALFAGQRADALATHRLAELIVRRGGNDLPTAPINRPAVVEHPPITMPQDQETLTQLLALPAPLPARDGAVAGALIRLGLLRAWCSSDAALAQALRRRRLRTTALRDILRSGRHPSATELTSWVLGDDAGQLAFPELLVEHTAETVPLLEVLERHLDALITLATHHETVAQADHHRSDSLRALLGRHDGTPIVAFSQFGATIDALYRALSDIAGIAMLTGDRARIASGTISRQDVLETFAPRAHGRAPPPAHQHIRLLLTTDLLAEGVNLQDAGVVVHLDLPWTAARQAQRLGRCVRIGSPHPLVHAYRFAASPNAERQARAAALILRKTRMHQRLIGGTPHPDPRQHTGHPPQHRQDHSHTTRSAAERMAHHRATLYALLASWHRQAPHDDGRTSSRRIAIQVATCEGALVRAEEWIPAPTGHGMRCRQVVLALTPRRVGHHQRADHPSWQHRTSIRALLQLANASATAETDGRMRTPTQSTSDRSSWEAYVASVRHRVWQAWRRMQRMTEARRLMGPSAREQRIVGRRLARHITQVVQQLPPDQRAHLRTPIAQARQCATAARGAAADAALQRWAARRDPLSPVDWLLAWHAEPVLCRYAREAPDRPKGRHHLTPSRSARLVLRDILLLVQHPMPSPRN